MSKLMDQDLRDVLLVTRKALECHQMDEMRNQVLDCLIKMFKSEVGGFILSDQSSQELDYRGSTPRGVDRKLLDQYIHYYHQLDPLHQDLSLISSVATIEEITPFKKLVQSEYYNDFVRRLSVHYVMGVVLRSGQTLLGTVRLARPQSVGNFTPQEKAKIEFMIPQLVGLLGKHILLNQLKQRAEIFESLSYNLPHKGIVILDEFLESVHVDERAHKVFSSLPHRMAERSEGQLLPEEIYRRCEALLDSVQNDDPEHHEQVFPLDFGQTDPLMVLLRLIKRGDRPAFLVCLEPGDLVSSLKGRLKKIGLSQREQEVAYLICKGLKDREIADKLCISRYTVENHLRSIYAKSGVNNRTRLMHRLIAYG